MIDFKLDYITRLFKSIGNKRFESYVIQRIWHQLNNPDVWFVTQQYFMRDDGKYALADLYLPQINLVIEIDEYQHSTIKGLYLDEQRSKAIQSLTPIEIKRITLIKDVNNGTCYSLEELNAIIDGFVLEIKKKINDKGQTFKRWTASNKLAPSYYADKGYLSVAENDYVKNIDDAAAIFGTKAVHRGFLRAGGFDVPNKKNTLVWLPSIYSKTWHNELSKDGMTIVEYADDLNKRKNHVRDQLKLNQTRITFYKEKDALGFNYYKFVGVFMINSTMTKKAGKCVWERINDIYKLKNESV